MAEATKSPKSAAAKVPPPNAAVSFIAMVLLLVAICAMIVIGTSTQTAFVYGGV
jgi:hypothetical protein